MKYTEIIMNIVTSITVDPLLIVCGLSRFRILYQDKQCSYGVVKVSTGIKKYILQQTEHSKPKPKIDANNDYAMVA